MEEAYLNDKNCVICNCKFGNIGFTITKKYFCKMCYRGVCNKCSDNRIDNNRCCLKCYTEIIPIEEEYGSVPAQEKITNHDYEQLTKEIDSKINSISQEIEESDIILELQHEQNLKAANLASQIETTRYKIEVKSKKLKKKSDHLKNLQEDLNKLNYQQLLIAEISRNRALMADLSIAKGDEPSLDDLNKLLISSKAAVESEQSLINKLKSTLSAPSETTSSLLSQLTEELSRSKSLTDELDFLNSQ